jgi:NAD(P)-dependent dehydrogenase (short-subunit alcohol dehydrogenase family)
VPVAIGQGTDDEPQNRGREQRGGGGLPQQGHRRAQITRYHRQERAERHAGERAQEGGADEGEDNTHVGAPSPLLARADFLALRRSTSLYRPVQRTNIRAHLQDARYRGRHPRYTTDAAYSLECLDFFTELFCRRVVQSVASEDGWLDILVNAAGGATVGSLMDLDDENTPTKHYFGA